MVYDMLKLEGLGIDEPHGNGLSQFRTTTSATWFSISTDAKLSMEHYTRMVLFWRDTHRHRDQGMAPLGKMPSSPLDASAAEFRQQYAAASG